MFDPFFPVIGSEKPVYIYGLIDPETDEVRYIGKSTRPLERLGNHMNEVSNCHRSHWLQGLKRRGLSAEIVIFERITGNWPWQASERYWIAYGRKQGWPLTNNTSGGDGVPDLPAETRDRMAAVWKGRKHSPQTAEKLRKMRIGVKHTAETKAKMSAAHKGRKITWAHKLGKAVRKLTKEDTEHITEARNRGESVISLAKKYGVHRTTISKIKTGKYNVD